MFYSYEYYVRAKVVKGKAYQNNLHFFVRFGNIIHKMKKLTENEIFNIASYYGSEYDIENAFGDLVDVLTRHGYKNKYYLFKKISMDWICSVIQK